MNQSDDIETVIRRVRDAFDEAVNEAEELSNRAHESFEDAIDHPEQRIESLRGEE
ncbi:hypothetical protein ACFQE8_21490 [Salinirubellus sp. GCM10025818]|uniref:hypothetical protein n=1 Tax=Salinirubellus TaxID=2162630 RepID=UPI0030D49216